MKFFPIQKFPSSFLLQLTPPTYIVEDPVAAYVASKNGTRPIRKVLMANNGIAAVKTIRSVRDWAYHTFGSESAIEFVAMVTPEDLAANAAYIRMAESTIEVPGGTNNNNYANVDQIVDCALKAGVDAVFAGWGHASENPKLPDALDAAGIVFIGPPGDAMRALGDKIASTIVAQSVDVPCLPWSGDGLVLPATSDSTVVPADLLAQACVTSALDAQESAARIGYPVMIKASEGGGGKGIRMVPSADTVIDAFRQVAAEVPGSPIFIMKLAPSARHLEVQLLCDEHGNAMALFGRDCSMQRRHQKVLEEGPVAVASVEQQKEMEAAAVRLAKQVKYVSAGTVEYLFFDNKFYFLELNPRLQVEHPVTEMITGVSIPASQLQIAMGIPLHAIPEIRAFFSLPDTESADPFDMDALPRPEPSCTVIAARITAENAEEGFKPTSGKISDLTFASTTNVWGYFSVTAGSSLHEFSDSQFGHLFASGPTREDARRALVRALSNVVIRGEIRTPVEYLSNVLETDDFKDNTFDTAWLDKRIRSGILTRSVNLHEVACGALARVHAAAKKRADEFETALVRGQIPPLSLLDSSYSVSLIFDSIKYVFDVIQTGPFGYSLTLNGTTWEAELVDLADGTHLVYMDGKTFSLYAREEAAGLRIIVDGRTCVFSDEFDPSLIRSLTPGKVVKFVVDDASHVAAGDVIADIEVMKMITALVAPASGVVSFAKSEGSILAPGMVVATLDLDDPSAVERATPYDGVPPPMGPPRAGASKPHKVLASAEAVIESAFAGYQPRNLGPALKDFVANLTNPGTPYSATLELLASTESRLPEDLYGSLSSTLAAASEASEDFPAGQLLAILDEHSAEATPDICAVRELVAQYGSGLTAYAIARLQALMDAYIEVESVYATSGSRREEVLWDLRDAHKEDATRVAAIARSHHGSPNKTRILVALLGCIAAASGADLSGTEDDFANLTSAMMSSPGGLGMVEDYTPQLTAFAALGGTVHARLALSARVLLIHATLPSFDQRKAAMGSLLAGVLSSPQEDHHGLLTRLVDRPTSLSDVLVPFFTDASNRGLAETALKAYIIRTYRAYDVLSLSSSGLEEDVVAAAVEFLFHLPTRTSRPMTPSSRTSSSSSLSGMNSPGASAASGGMMKASPSISDSLSELSNLRIPSPISRASTGPSAEDRYGMMFAVSGGLETAMGVFPSLLESYSPPQHTLGISPDAPDAFVNTINVMVVTEGEDDAAAAAQAFQAFISSGEVKAQLEALCVRRVTLGLIAPEAYPVFYTFRAHLGYSEDAIHRYIEPPLAFQLDIGRLSNYEIQALPSRHSHLHVYGAKPKGVAGGANLDSAPRIFVRSIVRDPESFTAAATVDLLATEGERILVDALDAIQVLHSTHPEYAKASDSNHIFINMLPNMVLSLDEVKAIGARFVASHGQRMFRLRVSETELKLNLQFPDAEDPEIFVPVRIQIRSHSGFVVHYHVYKEVPDSNAKPGTPPVFVSVPLPGLAATKGPWEKCSISTPYALKCGTQAFRRRAKSLDTIYVYDYPEVFDQAVRDQWAPYLASFAEAGVEAPAMPTVTSTATEYRLNPEGALVPCGDGEGDGWAKVGMVAWLFEWFTPEAPEGRSVVVIANDITERQGSFGPLEDDVFFQASALARSMGIPRVYLSANSGARIGMAEEIRSKYKIAWVSPSDPERGIKFLYLEQSDYEELTGAAAESVATEEVEGPDGRTVHKILHIVGAEHGIGVENLRASGMIAGETSLAYEDVFTISLVTGRSVGIGAYLVRLGQRIVQHKSPPILLTGAGALNKLLGSQVYTSNNQLGGIKIMHANGVSHLVCQNNLAGIRDIVHWISFVPLTRGAVPRPLVHPCDPVDRDIGVGVPESSVAWDPRHMLAGTGTGSSWESGFFDKDSFRETLSGWARTVVTGRARLGGYPVGVIAVETRAVSTVAPADPGDSSSQEMVYPEAGQVWYPNSAAKTAQAINDFNYGEELPLFIFANWRGFSGGMRDMFNEVLKFGSRIVDALRKFRQPIFIYIPPSGELRGGAWVVLDTTINEDMIEMYADEDARGGILEPAGAVEIKYKDRHLRATMNRLDETCAELAAQGAAGADALKARQDELLPFYRQVAVAFADLHDRPGRMLAKGVIREIVPWANARRFFYARLDRRLRTHHLARRIQACRSGTYASAVELVGSWLECGEGGGDVAVAAELKERWDELWGRAALDGDGEEVRAAIEVLKAAMAGMGEEERAALLAGLSSS